MIMKTEREMSENWRMANATLVFKKGWTEDQGNFRPVLLIE